jgi:hypothetical protein
MIEKKGQYDIIIYKEGKMKKIYLLIGIPGSGKSYWLKDKKNSSDCVFDDISQLNNPLDLLESAINNANIKNIYISDVNFLEISVLKKAEEILNEKLKNKLHEINYVIFKSTKEISEHNVLLRDDGRKVQGTIERFHKNYSKIMEYLKTKKIQIIEAQKYGRKLKP